MKKDVKILREVVSKYLQEKGGASTIRLQSFKIVCGDWR